MTAPSFRRRVMILVVAATTLPVLFLSYRHIEHVTAVEQTGIERRLQLEVERGAAVLALELTRVAVRAAALATDSDVERSLHSFLLRSRAEVRLQSFLRGEPLAERVLLLDSEGVLLTSAPLAADPPPVPTPIAALVARARQPDGGSSPTEPCVGPVWTGRAEPEAADGTLLWLCRINSEGPPAGFVVVTASAGRALRLAAGTARPGVVTVLLADGTSLAPRDLGPASSGFVVARALVPRSSPPDPARASPPQLTLETREPKLAAFQAARATVAETATLLFGSTALLAILAFALTRHLLMPLDALRVQVDAYAAGRYDAPRPAARFAEFEAFAAALQHMGRKTADALTATADRERLKGELARLQLQSELDALHGQMRPHFLFNTLNGIIGMIHVDADLAAASITSLATLYRLILDSSRGQTASLRTELGIAREYLELQQARFAGRVRYTIECSVDAERTRLPSLLLQTLVENAVKHGVAPGKTGGEIGVFAEPAPDGWVRLRVVNTRGSGGGEDPVGTGTGLSNTRKRLELLYGPGHRLSLRTEADDRTVVEFYVPERGEGTL